MVARVLLIDDEEIVRRVVRVVLEAEGHDVFEAADGATGITATKQHQPDVVVLDLMMPGMPGTDVCRELKSLPLEVKVIVLTALTEDQAHAQATECGADDFMEKPFSSLELLRRLAALVEAR